MKINNSLFLGSLLMLATALTSTATLIDFDSVNAQAAPNGLVDATGYLASYGITLSNITGGGQVDITYDNGGSNVAASSGHNFLEQRVSPNLAQSFTMNFSTPLSSLSFDYIRQVTSNLIAQWSATAYAGATNVGSVGEPETSVFGGRAAQNYVLTAGATSGITSLVIYGNGYGNAGNYSLQMDNLTLNPVPEPGTALFGVACVGVAALRRRRRPAVAATFTA